MLERIAQGILTGAIFTTGYIVVNRLVTNNARLNLIKAIDEHAAAQEKLNSKLNKE